MNKKFWIGFIVVFFVIAVVDMLVNGLLLESTYQQSASLWRSPEEMKMWLFFVVYLFVAFFFTLIFSKGYEGKGIIEGIRYGFYVGLLMSVPMAYGSYAAMPIPYSLALQWFLYGVVEYMIAGIVLSLIYGKAAVVAPVVQPAA